jgi:hypothetical protein
MRKRELFALVVCSMLAGWMLEPVVAEKGKGKEGGIPAPVPMLTDAEVNDLLFMREEEKLARDVYVALYAKWENQVFNNISQTEQRHTDAILGLLNKYGLDDPALEPGTFANQDLQDLFNDLVAIGQETELDALMIGARVEEVDMEDIVAAMDRTDKADILNVYGNLLAGSVNHLNAFVKKIEGVTSSPYEAQLLTQAAVDELLGR